MSQPLDIVIPMLTGINPAGGFRVLANLATEWVRSGHRVRIIAPDWTEPPYFPTEAEIVLFRGGELASRRSLADVDPRERKFYRIIPAMSAAIGRLAPTADVVLANAYLTAWPVAFASTRALKAYYIQAYETLFVEGTTGVRGSVFKRLAAWSYRLPLFQIVNAPVYLDYPSIRATTWVPPGLDLGLFHPSGRGAGRLAETPLVVGCIGRKEPWKETGQTFEAFRRLREVRPDARLRVAYHLPDGVAVPEGTEHVVPTSDAELADFYRSLDVLVATMSAQLGAAHYPVMEAMACGVPVVTTGYFPATDANAWLVPVRDVDAVVDALKAIWDHPDDARARAAQGLDAARALAWPEVAAAMSAAFVAERARRARGR